VCCSVLQCVALCYSALQSVAVCCSVLQCVSMCCSGLQSSVGKGWRRPIGCLKVQVIFRKRATNYRALLRKMTYEDKASNGSSPPCIFKEFSLFALRNFEKISSIAPEKNKEQIFKYNF